MHKKIFIFISWLFLVSYMANGQYISHVLEYKPAPGQLINQVPWGTPASAQSIISGLNGTLSLGAFGGYVVFRFAASVENHPDNPYGIDFTIFGNPMPDWSEPGIVWVMKDENGNGEPDETWYQLAGSDYYFSNTLHNYTITYTNPQTNVATDIPWTDDQGNSGYVYANDAHQQPYYPLADSFPHIDPVSYDFHAPRIKPEIDSTTFQVKIYKRGFGYADNQQRGTAPWDIPDNPYTKAIENSGGDGFDISWAIDTNGNAVELDQVDFVKVQNGMLGHAGWLGEISTEITGAIDVASNSAVIGETQMIVIRDLPPVIASSSVALEAIAFNAGKPQPEETIQWQVIAGSATVTENNMLQIDAAGEIKVVATLASNAEIADTVAATADPGNGFGAAAPDFASLKIYPNPAKNYLYIPKTHGNVTIRNIAGKLMLKKNIATNEKLPIATFPKGLYTISIQNGNKTRTGKFIKN